MSFILLIKILLLNSLSPTYVFKDSLRNPKLIPTFWFANYNQFKFLHCFHLTINKEYNINDIESAVMEDQYLTQKILNF